MKERSVIAVIVLTCITFGIYGIVWYVKTKNEMVKLGADVPTAWLLIVPIGNIYWIWKYAGGTEHVTRGKMSQVSAFLLLALLSIIGMAILQDSYNKVARNQIPAAQAVA